MTFSVMVLGCSAAIPTGTRHLSAHLLNANERFCLIDCGEGTQFQLRQYHIPWKRIDYVFISHLHGDHFFGLAGLLNSMHLLGRTNDLFLYTPEPLQEILDLQFSASATTLRYPLHFQRLEMNHPSVLIDNQRLQVLSFPLKHSIPACGFLFTEKNPPRKVTIPRSFAYCCDTVYDPSIVPVIRNSSLLYHEATFLHDMEKAAEEKFHSTALQAAKIAFAAEVKKMIIGHFSARYETLQPLLDEARTVFPETYLAEEGVFIDCGNNES